MIALATPRRWAALRAFPFDDRDDVGPDIEIGTDGSGGGRRGRAHEEIELVPNGHQSAEEGDFLPRAHGRKHRRCSSTSSNRASPAPLGSITVNASGLKIRSTMTPSAVTGAPWYLESEPGMDAIASTSWPRSTLTVRVRYQSRPATNGVVGRCPSAGGSVTAPFGRRDSTSTKTETATITPIERKMIHPDADGVQTARPDLSPSEFRDPDDLLGRGVLGSILELFRVDHRAYLLARGALQGQGWPSSETRKTRRAADPIKASEESASCLNPS